MAFKNSSTLKKKVKTADQPAVMAPKGVTKGSDIFPGYWRKQRNWIVHCEIPLSEV